MLAIHNANLILETEILRDGVLLIEAGRIFGIGKKGELNIPPEAERFDAQGAYIGPGFVDLHVHGGGGFMFSDAPEQAAQHFLSHGETTVLATLYYQLQKEEFLVAIDRIKTAMQAENGRSIAGFYMEGPYMNPKYGAMPEKNCWKGEIRAEDYTEIVDRAGTLAKVWAIAPERSGVEPFVAYARKVNPTVTIAVGHSEATPLQVQSFKPYGLTLQTHCMNATGRRTEWVGTRGCGPDEACLLDPNMYAELLSDSMGIHVNADLQRLILQVKGVDHVILISDSFVGDETSLERLKQVTDLTFDADGNLCGSCLTLDMACRNVMKHTGCSMVQAFLMASRNPARVLGLDHEIGTVECGKKANLVFVDHRFHVLNVMLEGQFVE